MKEKQMNSNTDTLNNPGVNSTLCPDDHISCVGVLRVNREFQLLATENVEAGELLFVIEGEITNIPSRYSVQVGVNTHIDLPDNFDLQQILDRYYWRFMNHHCEPNTMIRGRDVIAIRRIHPGEEITFDYNTTEYEMSEPFACRCRSSRCRGNIQGFKYLSKANREDLRPMLASYLLEMLEANSPVYAGNDVVLENVVR